VATGVAVTVTGRPEFWPRHCHSGA
jgi:hypothetical protein